MQRHVMSWILPVVGDNGPGDLALPPPLNPLGPSRTDEPVFRAAKK